MIYFNELCGATFDAQRIYRYDLWRIWSNHFPKVLVIGLNPSRANENKNDPTIKRLISILRFQGYGGLYMCNCFPFISPYPESLIDCSDKEISLNDTIIINHSKSIDINKIIFAWGNFKIIREKKRDQFFYNKFPDAYCFGQNKNGSPKHPLFLKSTINIQKFNYDKQYHPVSTTQ